jgi:Icc protein
MKQPQERPNRSTNIASKDGVDRRGFLECMAWAGAGLIWTFGAGVPVSRLLGSSLPAATSSSEFTFVQISDSHIGFDKAANPDVTRTFQTAVERINALPIQPDLIIHTGDVSHLSKPSEFDTAQQVMRAAKTAQTFYVPGEHDVATDNGQQFLERYGKGTKGAGWHSFDHRGVHFVGLVNVVDLRAGGLGMLGNEQVAWLEQDLRGRGCSTPVVVFAHIPLWSVYPAWGWGTSDSVRALSLLKRFGSVTVLNGHIHQIMQKVEGNISFHTAMATAFPQPIPGTAPSAGPIKVPSEALQRVLGITNVTFVPGQHHLAVVDAPLAGTPPAQAEAVLRAAAAALPAASGAPAANSGSSAAVGIDNFAFSPKQLTVKQNTMAEWTNQDDSPHTVTADNGAFSSPVLDTRQTFRFTFAQTGRFPYHCKLHPGMTGVIVVQ